jgi:hypothetical protein
MVTGASSGPLLGALTGSKLTISPATATLEANKASTMNIERNAVLFIFPSPFHRVKDLNYLVVK